MAPYEAGSILRQRRLAAGLSEYELAQFLSDRDVRVIIAIEAQRSPAIREVRLYIDALTRAGAAKSTLRGGW